MPLTSRIARLGRVTEDRKEEMFQLHQRYYSNVRRETFLRDMNEKDWVIILLDGEAIMGFSTLQLIRLSVAGAEHLFLFSGDTVVDRAHWFQDSTLSGSFGRFMLRLTAEHPQTPRHWFLISKGFRTYRFLPVFFNCFYPVYSTPTPPAATQLLDAVARHKFNGAYDAGSGLIRFCGAHDHLKAGLCEVPDSRQNDPHVRFFLERNPGYAMGDELACIADITEANLNRFAWRVIENTKVIWDE
jgi:hypothetical protein